MVKLAAGRIHLTMDIMLNDNLKAVSTSVRFSAFAATGDGASDEYAGIIEREEEGTLILGPADKKCRRRVLFVNSYGGRSGWERIKQGVLAPHHLWGCLELARMGYEVALAEPLPHFYLYRRPFPHDLRLLRLARNWLGPDDIIFSGHTLLYWIPLLKALRALKRHVVSLTYAKEELDFCRLHSGIVGLTPAAVDHARKIAPRVKVAYVGWGVDLNFFPKLTYQPEWFLSCGIANRDFETLSRAAALSHHPIRVICPGLKPGLHWSPNVTVIDGGSGWHTDRNKAITVQDLLRDYYPRTSGSLIIMKSDPTEYTANGYTNLMEAMALGLPVIVTRTGALPGELDVEAAGCGLHVPPEDPAALARAIEAIANDTERARAMGEAGRTLCENRFDIRSMAGRLHAFFESL